MGGVVTGLETILSEVTGNPFLIEASVEDVEDDMCIGCCACPLPEPMFEAAPPVRVLPELAGSVACSCALTWFATKVLIDSSRPPVY